MTKVTKKIGRPSLASYDFDGKYFKRTVKIVLNRPQYNAWKALGTPEIKRLILKCSPQTSLSTDSQLQKEEQGSQELDPLSELLRQQKLWHTKR